MSELSFLIELLLNHDIPKETKDLLAQRIRDVEANLTPQPAVYAQPSRPAIVGIKQAPSTLAAMARHGIIEPMGSQTLAPEEPAPVPVEAIAQTPATAAALNSRQAAIQAAMDGGMKGPKRKF